MFDVSYSYDICHLYKCIYVYQLYRIFDVFMLDFMCIYRTNIPATYVCINIKKDTVYIHIVYCVS